MMYIYFKLFPGSVKTYQVNINSVKYLTRISENKLVYKCSLALKKETFKSYVVNIKRSDISLNEHKEHSPINELFLIAGEALSDLDLEISKYGKIMKIKNIHQIQESWQTIKFKIESTYQGNIVSQLLTYINEKMGSEQKIIASLEKDPFYYHFLNGIYAEYSNNKCEFEGLLWGLSEGPLQIRKLNSLIDDPDFIYINYLMKIQSEDMHKWTSKLAQQDGDGLLEAKLQGKYCLSKEKEIESINARYAVFWNQELREEVAVDIQLETN